jgi:hypothetical protein
MEMVMTKTYTMSELYDLGAKQRSSNELNVREATIEFWKLFTTVDTSGKFYKTAFSDEETLKYYDEFEAFFKGYWEKHSEILGVKLKEEETTI